MGSSASTEFNSENVKCAIHLNYMKPPIYLCTNGHSLCNECITKLTVCSVCNSKMTDARNYTLEQMLDNFHYPCDNDGCNETYLLKDMNEHKINCLHVLYKCPVNENCDWNDKFDTLINHMKDVHDIEVIKSEQSCDILNMHKLKRDKFYLCYGTQLFAIHLYLKGNVIETNCQCYGPINNYCLNIYANGTNANESINVNKLCELYGSKKNFSMHMNIFKSIDAKEICYKIVKL